MIRDICRDESFLAQKAEPAAADDLGTAQDLLDTLVRPQGRLRGHGGEHDRRQQAHHRSSITRGNTWSCSTRSSSKSPAPTTAAEGCLSLAGTRKAMRFQTVKVQWQNERFQTRLKTFTGWTAEIIQHEIDHCDGILI